jgi:hypothetical protein
MQQIEAKYYVYEWVRPDYNEAYYVGKGSGKRAWNMVRPTDDTNEVTAELIKNGMRPEIRIIAHFVNEDSALEFEKERIAFLAPLGFLTNVHPGGKQPPSWKGKSRPESTRNLQGIAKIGDLNPMKRPEVVEKAKTSIQAFRASDDGKIWAEGHRAKLIDLYQTEQGKKILERMAEKNRAIQSSKGDAHHSKRPDVIEKIRASKIGGNNPQAVSVIEITTGLKFDTMKIAAKHFGISDQTVSKSCKLNRLTKCGHRFAYVSETEPNNG